jgi:hypothetical protein
MRIADRVGRRFLLVLTLDDDLAGFGGLEEAPFDELVDEGAVLLLVLLRQRVGVGVELHDDVLLPRLRVAAKPDDHLSHDKPLRSFHSAYRSELPRGG